MTNEKDTKKDELLQQALKAIEKEYGKGSIMKLGDRADVSIDAIPTGSLALDYALGIGGYPKGRIIEIYGPESSGNWCDFNTATSSMRCTAADCKSSEND